MLGSSDYVFGGEGPHHTRHDVLDDAPITECQVVFRSRLSGCHLLYQSSVILATFVRNLHTWKW